ncbi:glucose-6-phosphate dehydrogenase [Streptomyces sp. V3I7]|uniref:glucose-6-phosphate dehydrogenase n=1 Tax=Streptomyces sp. V3I7 TaxID=3042278 RepID=UPI00278B2647|nr:glucose-6-phosphate dehydrogenase [Streptomyces sp. V3I7]MDQ0994595.1 glucose-6-phosphate 1-dehydrogenase [Streptomyces sp. V3I7]
MDTSWTADALVIFGVTGDLAQKMTFPALYLLERRGLLDVPVIGVGRRELTDAQLADRARKAIEESGEHVTDVVFDRLARRLTYVAGNASDPATYERLAQRLSGCRRPLYYLAMPPALYAPIVEQLGAARLVARARVAVEKPFGHDLASARALNQLLCQVLEEEQILRVDHFLGKEPVIELEYLRFANTAMDELWHRDSVSAIQITMAEDFGVAQRGSFYDEVGALRDVVENHLLLVLALVTMDPPVGPSAEDLWAKKVEVLRATPAVEVRDYVRGQYLGYLQVPGVAPGSTTETYAALRMHIDNWRWAGVPVFIRAGKELPVLDTEVRLMLREPPRLGFLPDPNQVAANQIVLRIDPDAGMRLDLSALDQDNRWRRIPLETVFARELGKPQAPYERVLYAALTGDDRYFAPFSVVEQCWRIVQPLLSYPPPVFPYPVGSWGPPEAEALVADYPPWQQPWLPE